MCIDEELMKANHGASIDIGKADYYKYIFFSVSRILFLSKEDCIISKIDHDTVFYFTEFLKLYIKHLFWLFLYIGIMYI